MKKSFLLSIIIFSATSLFAQQGRLLTFDEAIEITLSNNPEISAIKYQEEAAEKEKKAMFGLRLPSAGINAGYMFMSEDIGFGLNHLKEPAQQIAGMLPSGMISPEMQQGLTALMGSNWDLTLQKRSFANVSANVSMPLYTGGKINAANNAARINLRDAQEKGDGVRNTLISEITERYFGLSLAMQVAEVRKQVLDGMLHHLADAKALEANGVISYAERLNAEVFAAEAGREYLKAQKTVETLNSALSTTLNTDGSYIPVTTMFVLNEIENVDYFKDNALENNPLLKQVSLQKELAQEEVRLQRSDFLPQVAVLGAASLYNYQVSNIVPKWTVGAGINLKIFDGLQREYKFGAAKSVVRQVDALNIKAKNDIQTLIDQIYNEMITFKEQLPSLETSVEFAEEYLRAKELAFKEGMAPSSDVVDARTNLAAIKTARLEAAYGYDVMLSRLLEASGLSSSILQYGRRPSAVQISFEN